MVVVDSKVSKIERQNAEAQSCPFVGQHKGALELVAQ